MVVTIYLGLNCKESSELKPTATESTTSDTANNVYVTGSTEGNLDGQILNGTEDMFITKYDPDGTKLWTRLLGVAGAGTSGEAIASDTANNVYVTGRTYGNLDGQTLTGTQDMFTTKYAPDGTRLWTRLLGIVGKDTYGYFFYDTVTVNNVQAIGFSNGKFVKPSRGLYEMFLVKYASDGTKLLVNEY